ncbi:MAG: hypothetical protein R2784_15120 [Saprospiraceae bacterium]
MDGATIHGHQSQSWLFKSLLEDVNAELTRHEHIKGFHLAFEPWTTEEGFITGTLKPKRRIIEERFFQRN